MSAVPAEPAPKLSRRWRWAVYGVAFGLWLTGVVWFVLTYYYGDQDFGLREGLARLYVIRTHVAFGLTSVWLFGILWAVHVVPAWRQNRKRWSGALMFTLFAYLAVTGYFIYHAAEWVEWVEWLHWTAGLGAPLLFLLHRFLVAPPAPD